ncbi:Uncharacterised protein [Legionella busanensis]|uniref:Uncharacterized protein n=1 Tax=Legionella busanensis TaxID=190655 RepID=A0A378JMR1_9GAMM|nr:hypothetical protein [Legionella busanensis]STX52357.1 Uncharacterised protein [Legionella busanensis]
MITEVLITKQALKDLKHTPKHLQEKFRAWLVAIYGNKKSPANMFNMHQLNIAFNAIDLRPINLPPAGIKRN